MEWKQESLASACSPGCTIVHSEVEEIVFEDSGIYVWKVRSYCTGSSYGSDAGMLGFIRLVKLSVTDIRD